MNRLTRYCLSLLLLTTNIRAGGINDSSIEDHRVPRVSGRIVKVYSGNRPEPYLCKSEGYKLDPNSCASFYRCVKERNGKFNVFRYQCAPGTVYDPNLETCNHPRSTRRTECGGILKPTETIDSLFVNEIEPQKELPRPINTNELEFKKKTTVKEGTVAQTEAYWVTSQSISTRSPLKTTIFQSPSTLSAYTLDSTKYNPGYNYVVSTNVPWTSNKEANDWSKTTSQPKRTSNSKYNEICSDDGFTGDADNCRKFYRCVGNQKGGFLRYEFFCSESTVWDDEIQSCNHPWAVKRSKCGRSISLTDKSETAELTSTVERSTQQPTRITEVYGHKNNKTIQQQLQISYGSKVTQTQTQISHSNQVIQNQTQLHYGDRISQNKDSKSKQNQTQIAHGSAVSQTQTQIDYGNKGIQTQVQIDHSNDSSQSQTQIHETTTLQTTTSKQDSNANNNNQCAESGFMGDSKDCKKFYRCVDSGQGTFTKYEYVCGDGTVWDQSIEACNHAWAVKECGGQSHSEIPSSSTEKSTTYYADTTTSTHSTSHGTSEATEPDIDDIDVGYGNQGQSETSTLSSSTSIKTTTTKQPHYETTNKPQPSNNGECKTSGFMGDANNCKRFYRCVDNGMGGYTRYEFTCGEGTVWDPSIEACNHAWAVERCGESQGSSEISQTSEPTTTTTNGETITTSTKAPVDKNTGEPIYTTTISSTSTTSNTEPNKNNICRESGFMGDNSDCKKFHRCVDNGDGTYTRYDFTCGEGTVWDSKIEACNHEWAVEKCGGNSESTTSVYTTTSQHSTLQDEEKENEPTTQNHESSSTTQSSTTTVGNEISTSSQDCTGNGFVGDNNDCKKFYRCVDNGNGGYDRYQFSCGEGTVWDDSISACNHAWAVKECGASGSGTSENSHENTSVGTVSSIEVEHQESTQQHTTERSTTASGNASENEVTEEDCEREGFFGSLVDCKKFIRCVNDGKGGFTKYEFNCGEGTTWNQDIQACDHPSPDRPCGQDYQSTTKGSHINDEMFTETTTKITSTTSSSSDIISGSQESQKPQSSGKCESDGFYGVSSDCKKFYRCVDDGKGGYTKYDFTCGDGTVWNQEILACDHESDDKSCLSSGVKPTEASGLQSESTTASSPSTTLINQGSDKTESPVSTSHDKCTSEGFYPHPHDCKKFIRCVGNGDGRYTRYEFSCGEGTIWVQEIQACDHDSGNTNCRKQSDPTTKPQDHDHSSTSTTESSSSSTSAESQTQHKEDDEYSTTKQPSSTQSEKCTSEGYFANKNDCKKFYRCVDNGDGGYTKYDFVCGEGTAWDSNIGNCNHINEVESCSENNKEESHTQQTMKDEETSQSEGTSSTTMRTTSSSGTTEESGTESETESSDKCESEGYHGNSKDCKKFYRCVDDGNGGLTKHDFTCGEGTIWDQDITNCNHPQDVTNPSCKSGEGGAEGDSETSSTSSTTSGSSTTSSTESTSSSNTSESNSQSSSNCSQEDSSKKPASSKDISCENAGYYPNPNDCKKFYRCVDWDGDGKRFSVYHFECGEGTIWDPALDTCNHEESVYPPRDCSQTQAHTESSSDGTTTKKQEETTTQESTTSEKTTTQESTTSEQTTTEPEQTTTQQSTTSEQTSTQQTTTSEQTTTQQSTTNEQTTTQQSTTSEQTTTQQSTTSEQTTTQQTTTSEQTTTQQTTTQQSTTTDQTTTQESTTSDQTTTQGSTTSEQTTTQESITSEQTTTQESTTSEQSTQEPTTSEQTTQESTTNEQTTEQTTTQESTTSEQSTTEQTTEETSEQTEPSTTEAMEGSTTEQSSTTEGQQESTTESSSSEKECPETDDDQYLFVCPTSFKRHPKYCNMFYQCTEDEDTHEVKIATFKCPNETIYDESQTQCVEEKKADKKCNGEMARRHRFKRLHRDSKEPITVDKESKSCPSVGYYAFEKNIECSHGFLKCDKSKSGKLRGYVHQCPEGYLFWTISKRCEVAANIRDCKRSSNDWQGRWNIPVDRKNVAF